MNETGGAHSVVRWLHLSDFHVGKDEYGQRQMFKYILENVRARVGAGGAPHFVFITGDIADKGLVNEYSEFNDEFFVPLATLLGMEGEQSIFVVPGNHDVDRKKARLVDRSTIAARAPHFFDPTAEGLADRKEILDRFAAYASEDLSASGSGWLSSEEGAYVVRRKVAGIEIGIIGINTAWLSQGKDDRHELKAGKDLVEHALQQLADVKIRLVLGHHPLDWLDDAETTVLSTLFGKNQVIYLHGHLHRTQSRLWEGTGEQFRVLQAGASFQAREDERWVNRLLWCELNVDQGTIRVEPLQWFGEDKEWKLDGTAFPEKFRQPGTDRWVLPLPGTLPTLAKAAEASHVATPPGWDIIDHAALLKRKGSELTDDQLLRFFDGSVPNWKSALSSRIPRRKLVSELLTQLESNEPDAAQITLLLGAGGEGKSTIFLQTLGALVDHGWQILWRYDENSSLPPEFVTQLPVGKWIIATDDAGTLARDVFSAFRALKNSGRKDIRMLLCSRDTDWFAAGGRELTTQSGCSPNEKWVRGLTPEDAEKIVEAWSKLGTQGLGRLAEVPRSQAAGRLTEAAKSESNSQEGAFLGAMLQVRFGDEMRGHVRSLLSRLKSREIGHDMNLRDAFAYIALMHTEGLRFLTVDVLARVLGCERREMRRRVLGPLGEEAAAANAGKFILTRHIAIAQETAKVLSEEVHIDTDELFVDLVLAAEREGQAGTYIENLKDWRYLSDSFFRQGRPELGIRLARALMTDNPSNLFFVTKVAHLYREAGQPEQSVNIFRNTDLTKVGRVDRGYLFEWGASEGVLGNHALNAWLCAVSASDQVREPLRFDRVSMYLAGISKGFLDLYELSRERLFIQACGAAAQLGMLTVDSMHHRQNLQQSRDEGVPVFSVVDAIAVLKQGVANIWEQREEEMQSSIPAGNMLTFENLERYATRRAQT